MNDDSAGPAMRALREGRAWSQEHLAAASGLNVRTIQRIESNDPASPETLKALAAAYEGSTDSFRPVFVGMTGSNNSQETRFVDRGALIGAVIVAYPTEDAPFAYHVEVYERDAAGRYVRRLRFRSRTTYGDGNRLAVIDSEMPTILQGLGLWKPGDAVPIPARRPAGCGTLVVRNGAVWCK